VLGGVARLCLEASIEDPLTLTDVATLPLVVDDEQSLLPSPDESALFNVDSEEEDEVPGVASSIWMTLAALFAT